MASTSFGETVNLVGWIRSILGSYPFSAGLLRELLQNSDDAGAEEQVFLLDYRIHRSKKLHKPQLSTTQGPALLAYNNSRFNEDDWKALRCINSSSKETDTAKIGRFGIGIRSCYHIADYLQVLSAGSLVILDPQRSIYPDGGVSLSLKPEYVDDIRDHLVAFSGFLTPEEQSGDEPFEGTIIRLPFRTKPSEIRAQIISAEEIEQFFIDFVEGELNVSMLFLRHLRSVKLLVIDAEGNERHLATATLEPSEGMSPHIQKQLVSIHRDEEDAQSEEWLVLDSSNGASDEDILGELERRVGAPCSSVVEKNKLRPDVRVAFPLPSDSGSRPRDIRGYLFTYLRLPIETGFPLHVHAPFALTPSRQNLRTLSDVGVNRHSEDYMLTEWNKLLFETRVPVAWAFLLENLAEQYPKLDIFSAWPRPESTSRDTYWSSMPLLLFDEILRENLAVWPTRGTHEYLKLEEVLVSGDSISDAVLDSLSKVGLNICGPVPGYIYDLIAEDREARRRILTPERAAPLLREVLSRSKNQKRGSSKHLQIILQYLVSSKNLLNIVGLPIVPTVSGGFVSLSKAGVNPTFTLLDQEETPLFSECDAQGISLESLPKSLANQLSTDDDVPLNIVALDARRVLDYLETHPTWRNVDLERATPTTASIDFASQFWLWLSKWDSRAELLPQLANTRLLPCSNGVMCADRNYPVFDAALLSKKPTVLEYLSGLGVPFLADLTPKAKKALTTLGFLKPPGNIPALLSSIQRCADANTTPTDKRAKAVLAFIGQHALGPDASVDEYTDEMKETLRSLRIFPVVRFREKEPDSTLHQWMSVENQSVFGVKSYGILPEIRNVAFVDAQLLDLRLLRLLNPSEPDPVTDTKILQLSIPWLHEQPSWALARILKHVVDISDSIDGNTRKMLGEKAFVRSGALKGTLKAPFQLVDPYIAPRLSALFEQSPEFLPRRREMVHDVIAQHLSSLGLFATRLSPKIVLERIEYIASEPSTDAKVDLSVKLINLIGEEGFDCAVLPESVARLAWLPTDEAEATLIGASDCRPTRRQGSTDEEACFDQVLWLLHSEVKIVPLSLRERLGWNEPIPTNVVAQQLGKVLDAGGEDVTRRVIFILKELAKRRGEGQGDWIDQGDWDALCDALSGKAWVPVVDGSEDVLVPSWKAVLSSPFKGIHLVKRELLRDEGCRKLLSDLGCPQRPTFDTVELRLQELSKMKPSSLTANLAVVALDYLVGEESGVALTSEHRSKLLVPDNKNHLRPLDNIVFNDMKNQPFAPDIDDDEDVYLTSKAITESLALKLGLERLGLKALDLGDLGEDMGVSSATIVQKTLAQYTEYQFLPEFLANADDAGATRFEVILNGYTPTTTKRPFLTSQFEKLYSGPSVLVCNDKEFSKADFEGICRTHVGSKADAIDSIGQFGLGVLTMFHITECAVVYSGDTVLFLDPSKTRLPYPDRASLKLKLKQLLRSYSGHTAFLEGLPYFNEEHQRVDGTIFYLALRSPAQAKSGKVFTPQSYTLPSFQRTILQDFEKRASDCLLFITVNQIQALERQAEATTVLWSCDACRSHGGFSEDQANSLEELTITIRKTGPNFSNPVKTDWLTLGDKILPDDIPPDVKISGSSKAVRVGLAAALDKEHRFQSKVFATLPLALPIALPVHINASFRMSSDRRQIRLDGGEEMRFNRWLLSDRIPRLYLDLLVVLGEESGNNAQWWPQLVAAPTTEPEAEEQEGSVNISPTSDTSLAKLVECDGPLRGPPLVIQSFYQSCLPQSDRTVFCSRYHKEKLLPFSDAVLLPSSETAPLAVRRIYDLLRPRNLVSLSAVRHCLEDGGARVADQAFLKDLLLEGTNAEVIRDELKDKEISAALLYLSSEDPCMLDGLPLLALGDDSWGTFKEDASSTHYFAPGSQEYVANGLFLGMDFVDPRILTKKLVEICAESLNVGLFDAMALRSLTLERLGAVKRRRLREWVDTFWDFLKTLPQDDLLKSIEDLNLVPAIDGGFWSLRSVQGGEALLTSSLKSAWLKECFRDLGIPVVDTSALRPNLSPLLQSGTYVPNGDIASRFLKFLSDQGCINPVVATLRGWPFARQQQFAEWFQTRISPYFPKGSQYESVARPLPVWIARRGSETVFRSISEGLRLLPAGMPLSVGQFCSSYVTTSWRAIDMDCPVLTMQDFRQQLVFPPVLGEGDDEEQYLELLQHVVTRDERSNLRNFPVPNSTRNMVVAHTLYEHHPFFDAAFGVTSSRFPLPSLEPFLEALPILRYSEGITFDAFATCARVLGSQAGSGSPDLADRGQVLFREYSERLPLRDRAHNLHYWQTLDHIRFIPRKMITKRLYLNDEAPLPQAITELPPIVSPVSVVREKYYPIAWTQRAALASEPESDRLAMVFPTFGVPTAHEVIEHLKALTKLPPSSLLLHDLKETYKWLNSKKVVEDCRGELEKLKDEPIFLNIESTSVRPRDWTWASANELALETHDLATVKAVRPFLRPFERLLKSTGVLEAHYPEMLDGEDTEKAEVTGAALLKEIQAQYNEFRLNGQFTDVVFVSTAPNHGEEESDDEDEDGSESEEEVEEGDDDDDEVQEGGEGDSDVSGEEPDDDGDPDRMEVDSDSALRGHRVVLGALVPYFKSQFTLPFREGKTDASTSQPLSVSLPYSDAAIKAMLDCSYMGQPFPSDDVQIPKLSDLLETLRLAHYLEFQNLHISIQREVITRKVVDPHNLKKVRRNAKKYDAKILERWLDDYETANKKYIEAAGSTPES